MHQLIPGRRRGRWCAIECRISIPKKRSRYQEGDLGCLDTTKKTSRYQKKTHRMKFRLIRGHLKDGCLVAPSTGWMLYYLCFTPSTARRTRSAIVSRRVPNAALANAAGRPRSPPFQPFLCTRFGNQKFRNSKNQKIKNQKIKKSELLWLPDFLWLIFCDYLTFCDRFSVIAWFSVTGPWAGI